MVWLKILALLTLIGVLIPTKIKVGYVLLIAAVAVSLLFGQSGPVGSLFDAAKAAWLAVTPTRDGVEFWQLLVIVLSIIMLEKILQETENITELIEALRSIFGTSRAALAGLPAIIGLFPSPGGALLSAPMVEKAAEKLDISAHKKTLINYWFRHVWEYTLPLYPGVIMIAQITALPLRKIILANLALTIVAILVGILYCLRGVQEGRVEARVSSSKAVLSIVVALLPLLFIVVVNVGFGVNLELAVPALVLSLVGVQVVPWPTVWKVVRATVSFETVLLVAGVVIFKRMLEVFDVARGVAPALSSAGAPVALILFLVPGVIGFLSGYMLAPITICTPLLLVFLRPAGATEADPILAMFLYAGSHTGVMLSPVHLCLALTREYFHADLKKVYLSLAIPMGAVVATATAVLVVCRHL